MLELVDLGQKLHKSLYRERLPELQHRLWELQHACWKASIPTVVVFEGWDAAGKGGCVRKLTERLEPRGFDLHHVTDRPRSYELELPWMWRFWSNLPSYGKMAIFDRSWNRRALLARVEHPGDELRWRRALRDIGDFERMLADDGYLLVKFFLHIDQSEQMRRYERWQEDPGLSWKALEGSWQEPKHYEEHRAATEDLLEQTESARSPWTLVAATDGRWARIQVLETLVARQEMALAETRVRARVQGERESSTTRSAPKSADAALASAASGPSLLDKVDLQRSLDREAYKDELRAAQIELHRRARLLYRRGQTLVLVFEGWDAAGKGGAIRRLTAKLDPRSYQVFAVAAPTDEERVRHYLWRFWRRLLPPREKQILIFDRSWYGRILVERVEGFARPQEWQRAYREINDFERQLLDADAMIVKLWFQVSAEEQLRRFEARKETPHKRWKLTDEDWRNRDKWPAYEAAVRDMLLKTSTRQAPWTLVEGNDKRWARIKTVRAILDALEPVIEGEE